MAYQPGTANSRSIPFPVGGWNTRDPLDTMEPIYAQRLDNIFPNERAGELRGGTTSFCAAGLGSGEVSTLTEHVTAAGARVFIACANGKIINITSGTASDLGTGFSVNRWQTIDFKGKKLFYNGTDQCQQFDGTTLSAATYTGIGTDNDLIQGTAYRNRLYLVPKNSASFWYGAPNAITGALTEYDVSPLLTKGGYIMFVTTWTQNTGIASDELLVIVSSEGEVLIYQGGNPDIAGFSIAAHLFLGKPLGRRGYLNYLSDVEIMTQTGVVSLANAIGKVVIPGEGDLTDKISPTFNDVAKLYSANFGWQAILYPNGRRIVYNIPISSGSQSHQYVRNVVSGAWCRFTGMNAASWGIYNDVPYYGTFDGKVIKADTGANDQDANISFAMFGSYNYYGDREHVKHFNNVRPIFLADSNMTLSLTMSVDGDENISGDTVSVVGTSGALWDSVFWDTTDWGGQNISSSDWYAINGIGRSGALKMEGSVKDVRFSVNAFHVTYDSGGIL
jgi:hypothetical protein